jgi:hypothetical protein
LYLFSGRDIISLMTLRKKNPKRRGRKPKARADKFIAIAMTVPPKLLFRIDDAAAAVGQSRSEYICGQLLGSLGCNPDGTLKGDK